MTISKHLPEKSSNETALEESTSSSGEYLANQLRERVSGLVMLIAGGSGPMPCGSLATLTPDGSYSRILSASSPSREESRSRTSSVRWPDWGIALGGELGALPTWERRTDEQESSSLGVGQPTPRSQDAKHAGVTDFKLSRQHGMDLLHVRVGRETHPTQGELWASPRASDGEKGGPNQRGSKGDQMLPSQVQNWPTPSATDHKGSSTVGRAAGQLSEATETGMWATPTISAGSGGPGNSGTDGVLNLRPQVQGLSLNSRWTLQLVGLPADWMDYPNDHIRIAASRPKYSGPRDLGQDSTSTKNPGRSPRARKPTESTG